MPNFNILLLALVVRYAKASAEPVLLIHGRSDLFFFYYFLHCISIASFL